MMRRVAIWSVVALLLSSPAFATSPEKDPGLVGKASPAFEITDVTGKPISMAKLYGEHKATVINFWGVRCGACLEEMPSLNALFVRYGGKVAVLGVNVDGLDGELLAAQIRKKNFPMTYTIVPDPDFRLADAFKMTGAPLTFIVDSRGYVRYRHDNFEPGDERKIEEVVRGLAEGGASRAP